LHWCRFGRPDHPLFVFTLFQPQVATTDPPLLRALLSAAR
jgi:hypothetical protein